MTKLAEVLLDPNKIDENALVEKLKEIDKIIDAHKKYDASKKNNLSNKVT